MDRSLAAAVAAARLTHVEGRFERHTSPQYRTLKGSRGGGRWGPAGAFPVIYLGRPRDSVIAEAYRHLVDPIEGMTGEFVGPRVLLSCNVSVSGVLDLRDPANLVAVGLAPSDLSADDHGPCQRVGSVVHQLGFKGVLAASATGLGETLALFERHLEPVEAPVLISQEVWPQLPPDPRGSELPIAALLRKNVRTRQKPKPEGEE